MRINNKKRKIIKHYDFNDAFWGEQTVIMVDPRDRFRYECQKANCIKRKHGIPQRYALLRFVNEANVTTGYQRIAKERKKFMMKIVYENDNYHYPRLRKV